MQRVLNLSPQIKQHLRKLSLRWNLNKQTQLRSIHLLEEFLQRNKNVPKNKQVLYLRVAILVSSKNQVVGVKEGRTIREPGIRITNIIKQSSFKIDEFLETITDFLSHVKVEEWVGEYFREFIRRFRYCRSYFQKYDKVFQQLDLSVNHIENNKLYNFTTVVRDIFWMVLVLARNSLLNNKMEIISSVVLMACLFKYILQQDGLISNHLISTLKIN